MDEINVQIEKGWKKALEEPFNALYFHQLKNFLIREKAEGKTVYPAGKNIFAAFDLCPYEKVKVVLLGQDPYHGAGQAQGLCFSVPEGIRIPPSLRNIFKELNTDLGNSIPTSGNLTHWAKQGVLLLNATLTVRAGEAGSHQKQGWEQFTDSVIQTLSTQKSGLVFIFWGNFAKAKAVLVDSSKHAILTASHPASEAYGSGGFFGCKHFSKTNELLKSTGQSEINWQT